MNTGVLLGFVIPVIVALAIAVWQVASDGRQTKRLLEAFGFGRGEDGVDTLRDLVHDIPTRLAAEVRREFGMSAELGRNYQEMFRAFAVWCQDEMRNPENAASSTEGHISSSTADSTGTELLQLTTDQAEDAVLADESLEIEPRGLVPPKYPQRSLVRGATGSVLEGTTVAPSHANPDSLDSRTTTLVARSDSDDASSAYFDAIDAVERGVGFNHNSTDSVAAVC